MSSQTLLSSLTFSISLELFSCRENPTICPIEKQPFSSIDLDGAPEYFVDRAKEKEIGNLSMECPSKLCQWIGCIRDFIKVCIIIKYMFVNSVIIISRLYTNSGFSLKRTPFEWLNGGEKKLHFWFSFWYFWLKFIG